MFLSGFQTDLGFLPWYILRQDTLLVSFRNYNIIIVWYVCGTSIVNESCDFASRNGNYRFMEIQVKSGLKQWFAYYVYILGPTLIIFSFFEGRSPFFESYRCHSTTAEKTCPPRGHSEYALTLSSAWVPTIRKWPWHLWIASYFMRHWQIWIAFFSFTCLFVLFCVSICMNCGEGSNQTMWHSPRNGNMSYLTQAAA